MRPLVLARRANPWSICDDIDGRNFQAVETARFEDGWSDGVIVTSSSLMCFFYLETGGGPMHLFGERHQDLHLKFLVETKNRGRQSEKKETLTLTGRICRLLLSFCSFGDDIAIPVAVLHTNDEFRDF